MKAEINTVGDAPSALWVERFVPSVMTPAVPVAAEAPLRVTTVSDYPSFLALEPTWNALVEKAGIDHPFLRHEWLRTWLDCFGQGHALHILVVRSGAEVIAIAPLMQSVARIGGLTVRKLESLHNDHTPRFDFILTRRPDDARRAIWEHLMAQGKQWDVLELRQLFAGAGTLSAMSRLAADCGYLVGVWHGEQSPVVPFAGTWDSYLDRLSRNHWAKVRKGLNRLARTGDVRLETVPAGAGLAQALDDGLRIEAAAWKDKTGTAIASQPEVEVFYRVFAEHAADMGALRLLFLNVAGARIAFAYALCYCNKLYVLKAGYDPAYSYYSPYNLLCYLVFQDGFARGLTEYEFLGANESWKLDWTQETRPHDWLYVFAPRLRMRLLYYAKFHWLPLLQRQPLYRRLRAAIFVRGRRAGTPREDSAQVAPSVRR